MASQLTTVDWNSVLRELFCEYASSGNRRNRDFLTFLKLQKLLTDAGVVGPDFTSKQLEICFYSETKRCQQMPLEAFLNFLPRLAEQKFPGLYASHQKEALNALLNDCFLPLYAQTILPRKNFPSEALELNEDVRDILASIILPLKNLYKNYFPWESAPSMRRETKLDRSQKALHAFLRDFDICPSLISKPALFRMWNEVVVCSEDFAPGQALLPAPSFEEGQYFSFSKFLLVLYLCTLSSYSQDPQLTDCPPAEKLLILLERMELARDNRKGSQYRPQTSKDSLLPSREVMEQVIYGPQSVEESSLHEEEPAQPENLAALCLSTQGLGYLQEHLDALHQIFQSYCSFGEPMNTTRLKSAKFIKMLKDAGLLKDTRGVESFDISTSRMDAEGLSKVDVDLIFSKLTGSFANAQRKRLVKGFGPSSHLSLQSSSSYGRMEFQEFLKALELIADKLFLGAPLEEAFKNLLDGHILALDSQFKQQRALNNEYAQVLMQMLQNEDVIEVLGLAHQVMTPYFLYYADSKGFMNFEAFMKFCKDFQIFPSLVNKSKLLRFFYTLAGIQARTELEASRTAQDELAKTPGQTELELIDQHLFIEALALVAAEIHCSNLALSPVHRVCLLVERLSQSSGPIVVGTNMKMSQPTVRKVDILLPFRKRYPEVFSYVYGSKRPTFSELMA